MLISDLGLIGRPLVIDGVLDGDRISCRPKLVMTGKAPDPETLDLF